METHPRPDTALVSNIIPIVILFIFVYGRLMMIIQVNTGVLDTVLLSLHPAEVKNFIWLSTKTNLILLKVVAANDEVSQRTKEGLAQLHSSPHLTFCDSNVIVARFHALIKLEKVEEEEMKALLENLPDEFAAMLGENQNWIIGRPSNCNMDRKGTQKAHQDTKAAPGEGNCCTSERCHQSTAKPTSLVQLKIVVPAQKSTNFLMFFAMT